MIIDRSVSKYYEDRARLLKTIKNTDERNSFIFATLVNFQNDGWRVAANRLVCVTLEECVNLVDLDGLILSLKVLSKDWDGVIRSKFCHHLLQKVLFKCQSEPFHEDPVIIDFVTSFLDHVRDHMDAYLDHEYARHTVRVYLQLFAGVKVQNNPITKTYGPNDVILHHPFDPLYKRTLKDLINKILWHPDIHNRSRDETSSPVIQIILLVINARCPKFITKNLDTLTEHMGVYKKTKKKQLLPDGFIHPVLVYIMELLIILMPGKQFAGFLSEYVIPQSGSNTAEVSTDSPQQNIIQSMVTHPIGNCIFRSILRRLEKGADLKAILHVMNQAESPFAPILASGQHAVINNLASTCTKEKFAESQSAFLKMLHSSFGYAGKKHHASGVEDPLILCVVGMIPSDQLSSSQYLSDLTAPVTLAGCLLAQTLFTYENKRPSVLAFSLSTLSEERMLAWAKHAMLSRVVEAALKSSSVSKQRKLYILSIFEKHLVELAYDRFGSRIVESLWGMLDFEQNADVINRFVSKLASVRKKLSSHPFGHFIHYKLMLDMFVSSPEAWKKRISRPNLPGFKRPHSDNSNTQTGKRPELLKSVHQR